MSKVYQFEEPVYFLNDNPDLMKSSNYLSHAKANVKLFLDGVRRIDGFPVLAFFSFEDLFLHQNKSAILGCLSNLHMFATRMDIYTCTNVNSIEPPPSAICSLGQSNVEGFPSKSTVDYEQLLEELNQASETLQKSTIIEEKKEEEEEDEQQVITYTDDSFIKTNFSVFTLPLIIVFALVVILLRVYFSHHKELSSPEPVTKRRRRCHSFMES